MLIVALALPYWSISAATIVVKMPTGVKACATFPRSQFGVRVISSRSSFWIALGPFLFLVSDGGADLECSSLLHFQLVKESSHVTGT